MNKNARHLVLLWAMAIFFGGLTLFGAARAIIRGEYLIPAIVALLLVFAGFQFWYQRRKALSLFLSPTSDAAVSYYRRNKSKLPTARATMTYMRALARTFYGEFESARNELEEVSWNALPPLYQGLRTHVLTIIAILEQRDYPKALELARETRELSRSSSVFPGSKTARRSTEALVDACEVLAGCGDEESIGRLETAVWSFPPLAMVIPALALAHHHAQHGEEQKAIDYRAMISRVAPHCGPLNEAP